MQLNVFVYHGGDGESTILADVVRFADAEGRFEFLPVQAGSSMQRMVEFLRRQKLDPKTVQLPFVIMVDEQGDRKVLHGVGFQTWLGQVVEVVLQNTPRETLRDLLLSRMNPFIASLIQHCMTSEEPMQKDPIVEEGLHDDVINDDESMMPHKAIVKPDVPRVAMRSVNRPTPRPPVQHEPTQEATHEMTVDAEIPQRNQSGPVNVAQSIAEGKNRENPNTIRRT